MQQCFNMCQIRNYHDTNRQHACDPDRTKQFGANTSTNKVRIVSWFVACPELAWELTVVQTRAIEMRMLTGRRPVMAFSNGAGEKNVFC